MNGLHTVLAVNIGAALLQRIGTSWRATDPDLSAGLKVYRSIWVV